MNPRNRISVRTGSEGPAHDPYHFDEITFEGRNGKTTLHSGLAQWCKHDGKLVAKNDAADTAFIRLTGLAPGRAIKIERELPWRRHAARCPERRNFRCEGGMPGESLTVCGRCGDVVDYHFDRSAVE